MDSLRSSVFIGTHHDTDQCDARPYRCSLISSREGDCSFTWTWVTTGETLDLEIAPDTPFVDVWERIIDLVTAT